jgi:hypothetical protein
MANGKYNKNKINGAYFQDLELHPSPAGRLRECQCSLAVNARIKSRGSYSRASVGACPVIKQNESKVI